MLKKKKERKERKKKKESGLLLGFLNLIHQNKMISYLLKLFTVQSKIIIFFTLLDSTSKGKRKS